MTSKETLIIIANAGHIIPTYDLLVMCNQIEKDLDKLEQYKNIEEEIGIDLITLFKALKNGIYAEHRYVQQCYICFIDGEWTIANLKNDEWWLLKDYGKTWALTKEELE